MSKSFGVLPEINKAKGTDEFAIEQDSATVRVSLEYLERYVNSRRDVKRYDTIPFKYAYYRNKEKDNNMATADHTAITVSSVPTGGFIQLANVPYDPSIVDPEPGKEWVIRPADGNFANSYKITGGTLQPDGSPSTLNVTAAGSSPSLILNEEVVLINPFRTQRFVDNSPLLTPDSGVSWRNSEIASGPLFKHSAGHYVWIIHAVGSERQIGYATADNIEGPWAFQNGDTPIVTAADFDATYDYINARESLMYLPEEERYCCVCGLRDPADAHRYHLGLWKFDEDFNNMEFIDHFYENAANDGNSQGSVIKFKNKYFLFTTHRTNVSPTTSAWLFQYVTADALDGNWSAETTISTGITSASDATKDGQWYSGWIDSFSPFVYNGVLYVFVGGTAMYSESGFALNDTGAAANRQTGLFYYDEITGTFLPDARGAVVINPQDANANLWPDYQDLDDHGGAHGNIFVDDDGKVYLPYSIKRSSPSAYVTMIVELLIT